MSPLISNLIVAALVAIAAAVIGRRAWRTLRGTKTGCGCEHCPAVARRGAAGAPPGSAPVTPLAGAARPPAAGSASPQRGA